MRRSAGKLSERLCARSSVASTTRQPRADQRLGQGLGWEQMPAGAAGGDHRQLRGRAAFSQTPPASARPIAEAP